MKNVICHPKYPQVEGKEICTVLRKNINFILDKNLYMSLSKIKDESYYVLQFTDFTKHFKIALIIVKEKHQNPSLGFTKIFVKCSIESIAWWIEIREVYSKLSD